MDIRRESVAITVRAGCHSRPVFAPTATRLRPQERFALSGRSSTQFVLLSPLRANGPVGLETVRPLRAHGAGNRRAEPFEGKCRERFVFARQGRSPAERQPRNCLLTPYQNSVDRPSESTSMRSSLPWNRWPNDSRVMSGENNAAP